MPANTNSNDVLNHEGNIKINESHNLILKIYATLLTNSTFQNGLRQLTRISQPLIGKFDDNLVKLTSNVSRWVSHDNIFNQLANIWLVQNYPVTENIAHYESFTKEFETHFKGALRVDKNVILKNFYEFGTASWGSLNQPSVEAVKNAILEFVARTINKTYNFPDETLSRALYNMLRQLIEKRRELVSGESFLNLIRTSVGEEFHSNYSHSIKAATNEFYIFAKRFILIDFPLATNNKDVVKLIFNFLQDNTFYYGDSTLNFVEKKLNTLLRVLGQPSEENVDENSIAERAQRIFRKVLTLSKIPFKKLEAGIHQVQNTKTYTTIDNYLHINNRVDETLQATARGYSLLKDNILEPSVNVVRIVTDKATSQVIIVLHRLEPETLKKRYTQLCAKYEVLQKCVVIVKDETINFVLDTQAVAETSEEARKQINKLFHEFIHFEAGKIKNTTLEYYTLVLKRAQVTYNTARKSVYNQKMLQNDEVAASAIRPPSERRIDVEDRHEVETRRRSSQPDSNAEVSQVETSDI